MFAQYKNVNRNKFKTSQHVDPCLSMKAFISAIYFKEKLNIGMLIHWQIQTLMTKVKEHYLNICAEMSLQEVGKVG